MRISGKRDGRPGFFFYVQDWLADAGLSLCSPAAQGAWIHLLCRAWTSPERGVLLQANGKHVASKTLAKWMAITEAEACEILSELEGQEVVSRRADGALYSRRMVRDASLSSARSNAGRKGGRASKTKAPPARAPSVSVSSSVLKDRHPIVPPDEQGGVPPDEGNGGGGDFIPVMERTRTAYANIYGDGAPEGPLRRWVRDYGREWVELALAAGAEGNAETFGYVDTILQRFKAQGYADGERANETAADIERRLAQAEGSDDV